MQKSLVKKYNVPGPRYTSYPTVPYWNETEFTTNTWVKHFQRAFQESNEAEGISLYIHLPFCEALCTFCACNKRITKNHGVEEPYIQTVLNEWQLYLNLFSSRPKIKEIHLGGGTPTFFSPSNLEKLIRGILDSSDLVEEYEFSIEGHPNNTNREHMQLLFDLGFRRISFGVQDYDSTVQKAINRIQPYEKVKEVTQMAREIGYESISHDLVFGLPFQDMAAIEDSISKTNTLNPDRIAFYSYAHVPWIKGVGQRGFNEDDLPPADLKRMMYERGKELFEANGYFEIGMDHFAKPHDSMYKSMVNKRLHRNFMGYTSSTTQLMIGLGVSSISDAWYSFAQNSKTLEEYKEAIHAGELAVFRGHHLTETDLIIRRHILNIMCHMETSWSQPEMQFAELPIVLERLKEMEQDNLLEIHQNGVTVFESGRSFVRNICMAFDLRMIENKPSTRLFSMTI